MLVAARAFSAFVGCGGTDDRPTSVPLDEWVGQFDAVCEAVAARLGENGSGLSDAEFAAFTAGAVTVLRTLRPPDEHADVAAELLADMESSQGADVDQVAIDEIDGRILSAMTTLGVSDTCIGGDPG